MPHTAGYLSVSLWKNNKGACFLVHRVIAAAFLGVPGTGLEVNHKDGNKRNNRLENLEYVTRQENIDHAVRLGLIDNKGERNAQAKLTASDVARIREAYKCGSCGYKRTATMFGYTWGTVRNVVARKTWKHV